MKNKLILRILVVSVLFAIFTINGIQANSLLKRYRADLNHGVLPKNQGHVSYRLIRVDHPNKDELSAYRQIEQVMDSAIYYYNSYTTASKKITVYYVADQSVRADGNMNGNIRFGPNRTFMNVGTATHEIGHTLGVGTSGKWQSFWSSRDKTGIYRFSGKNATNMLRKISGDANAQLSMDSQHFWPYGLNYAHEYKEESDLINYCKILNAMLQDGL